MSLKVAWSNDNTSWVIAPQDDLYAQSVTFNHPSTGASTTEYVFSKTLTHVARYIRFYNEDSTYGATSLSIHYRLLQ